MHFPLPLPRSARTSRLTAPIFDPQRPSQEVRTLSSDEFEGRGPATAGETKTVAYVVEQMKAAGLEPGGDLKDGQRARTQAVPLARAEISGTPKFPLSVAGQTQKLTQGEEISVRASLDGSKSVALANLPLVFCGYGVKAPERKWDDFKGVDLHGKIMVVLINDPDFETGVGDFGGKAMTYYGRWTYKYEEGARQGAAGILIVHETDPAAYGWATVKNSNTNTMFDIVRKNAQSEHTKVEGWIQRDLAVDLFKRAGLDFEALKKQAQTREFKPVTLKDSTFSADFAVDQSVITSQNILGRVVGSKRPDEVIIYTAHWDHLGAGAPDAKGDKIYNGAIDNATGTDVPGSNSAACIRTWTEAGTVGRVPQRHRRGKRSAWLGVLRGESVVSAGQDRCRHQHRRVEPERPGAQLLAVGQCKVRTSRPADCRREGGRSGVQSRPASGNRRILPLRSFPVRQARRAGIVVRLRRRSVDGGKAVGDGAQGIHPESLPSTGRQWQASWTFSGMTHDLPVLYKVGSDLANSSQWPNWSDDSEFRATRDATAAERK